MTRIGLSMIVRDEAPVIRRCLASVRPLMDFALIVDTGSTDATRTVIRDWLATQGVPGEVVDEPWRDFGHNRSLALARLRQRTEIDYALVMDADDTLVFADNFDALRFKQTLDKDLYHLEVRHGLFKYWRPQILSNRLEFGYEGVLHEFVAVPAGASAGGVAPGLHIAARSEGARSRNPNKHRDDALILEEALATEGDEFMRARYTFYLAQSWAHAGEKEKALQVFLRRAELDGLGWDQEVCLSLYYAAQLKEALGYPDSDVIGTYLKAHEADPRRAEPLHGAMRHCRLNNKHHQGYLIGKHAISVAEPFGVLALQPWIYDYGLLDEFCVLAYRSGHHRDCLQALGKILANDKLPESVRAQILLRDNARPAAATPSGPMAAAATPAGAAPAHAFREALALHRQGKLDEARRRYHGILADHPSHVASLHNLGALCVQQGKHEDAIELLRETLRLDPDHADAHNNLGAALRGLGRFAEAEPCFREAIRLKPGHPEAHDNLGATLKDLGRR